MEQSANSFEIDNLMAKWLSGEASSEEAHLLQQWIDASSEHAQLQRDFSKIWEQHARTPTHYAPDEEDAWHRFLARVQPGEPVQPTRTRFQWPGNWTVAAALLIAFSIGLIAYLTPGVDRQSRSFRTADQVKRDTLPDGSIVTLNKRSSLAYESESGKTHTRSVTLDGEAFFDVKPDPGRPFQIAVNDVIITVLGTSFHVNGKGATTEVVVETGLVRVENKQHFTRVPPGYRLQTIPSTGQLSVAPNRDLTYQYLRTGKLVCQNMPLPDLIERLSTIFETEIDLKINRSESLKITTTFTTADLEQILSIIAGTFNAKVEQSPNGYLITSYEESSEK